MSKSKSKSSKYAEAEIVHFLKNSPKGQLRYETGWDQNPQAIWQLVSSVQAEADATKIAVVERALKATKASEQKRSNEVVLESALSPLGTSSGSGSRITLLENDCSDNGNSNSEGFKSPRPRRKGYGIREDEYDDEAMAKEFELQRTAETHNHLTMLILDYEKDLVKEAGKKSEARKLEAEKELSERLAKVDLEAKEKIIKSSCRDKIRALSFGPTPEFDAQIRAKVEEARIKSKQEFDALDISCEKAQRAKLEAEKVAKIASENAAAESRARVAAIKAIEEQKKLENLQKAQEEDQKRQEAEAILKQQQKEQKEADLKLEAQKLLEDTKKESNLPSALQGLILKEDCDKYQYCNNLIQKFETATHDIVAGSPNPEIKKFYSSASKCINTPLNAIANTDPGQLNLKVNHFVDLIEGKSVVGTSSMTQPFSSSTLPNGKFFVIRLLAFRFVKKAEAEILSEKKGFIPLATVGVKLCKRFPEWAALLQAYFFKLCPFLVPFSFPRGEKSVQEYCNSLGYDLKGEESTLLNELLGRIKGYCSLYAIMVQTFEKEKFDIGDPTSFFTIGGIWQILTKTMKLDPQPDVTVMVIQTLLEIMSDRLQQVYGQQYLKLMNVLISVYLPKINQVSVGPSQAGVNRFQTFLEQKFRRPGFR